MLLECLTISNHDEYCFVSASLKAQLEYQSRYKAFLFRCTSFFGLDQQRKILNTSYSSLIQAQDLSRFLKSKASQISLHRIA